jgi:hypothetical protein
MSKPWFRNNQGGGWYVPAAPQGWAILGVFIAAVLGSAWLPASDAKPFLFACGAGYVGVSWWFSRPT